MTNDETKPNDEARNQAFRLVGAVRQNGGWAHKPCGARERFRHSDCGLRSRVVIRPSAFSGFTLIELILVMAILTIAVSFTAPALANFFRGRTLDSEARRLLALTRQGQSRAVSEGIPMELWINASEGTFGLEAQPSYEATDPKASDFKTDGDIQLEVVNGSAGNPAGTFGTARPTATSSAKPVVSKHPDLPKIRFLPDGSVSEASPQMVRLTGRDGTSVWVAQSRNRLNYEIRTRIN